MTITPVLVADLPAGEERPPVCGHVIGHPDGRVLVDTGLTALHPLVADMDPRLVPLDQQDLDPAGTSYPAFCAPASTSGRNGRAQRGATARSSSSDRSITSRVASAS
ncbi:hypothetical protein QDR37_12785 [Amnibacterium sp. CER49]|uniref:hypothetical protein n=1 Tax=Amnibacterium sp. CER49 TaxID=3039161 RepID=UPI002446C97B|nr:hypothetical protein [Amnibacterium sp. CER49]MDH2444824.1 hypothetical protein [Amnibacterium sp. CER49]